MAKNVGGGHRVGGGQKTRVPSTLAPRRRSGASKLVDQARLESYLAMSAKAQQVDALLDILNAVLLAEGGRIVVADAYTFGQPRRRIEVDRQPGRMILTFAPDDQPGPILGPAGVPVARA